MTVCAVNLGLGGKRGEGWTVTGDERVGGIEWWEGNN